MKSFPLFFLVLLLGFCTSCESVDPCIDVECGPGNCVQGICYCPEGFYGDNCEIQDCFGAGCINGDCDPQTESCHCYPNYYGESCDILCVNGEFANVDCNCFEGYEGTSCETEIRDRFLGTWDVIQWTTASQIDGSPVHGFEPGAIVFEEAFNILNVNLFTRELWSGMMLVNSGEKVLGQVTENTINFELQYLTIERTVYGSAILGDDRMLSIELYLSNSTTSLTEVAKGTFSKH